jgi:hypothetical protein
MMEGNPCMGHRKYEDVLDADTAGAMWPRGPDGHRTGGRRLLGALPEVRHHGTGAGDVGRSTTSAVGTGGGETGVGSAPPFSSSRERSCLQGPKLLRPGIPRFPSQAPKARTLLRVRACPRGRPRRVGSRHREIDIKHYVRSRIQAPIIVTAASASGIMPQ